MKKRILSVLVTMIAVAGIAQPVFARTQSEAQDLCDGPMRALYSFVSGSYLTCVQDPSDSGTCSPNGGASMGMRQENGNYYHYCSISFTSGSGTTNGGGSSNFDFQNNSNSGSSSSNSGSSSSSNSSGSSSTGSNADRYRASGNSSSNSNCVDTTFWGNVCGDAEGSGIFRILNTGLNILTWGVGIAATIGIIVCGIMYMTARDNEAQMTKAKNRIVQIVIGLAIYAMMWALLNFLLPGGVFGTNA